LDYSKAILIVSITLVIVIVLNAAIFLSSRRKKSNNTIEMFRKAAKRARNPWEDEDAALSELSDLVDKLKTDKDKLDLDE
jgi:hypothetical protein